MLNKGSSKMDQNNKLQDKPNETLTSLSPRKAYELTLAGAAIVDIRPEFETSYRVFDVPSVFYLSYRSYQEDYLKLPKDMLLIVADSVGTQSLNVARFMYDNGYNNVARLVGGIVEWERDGLPLSKDIDYALVGGCACRLQPQNPQKEESLVNPKHS